MQSEFTVFVKLMLSILSINLIKSKSYNKPACLVEQHSAAAHAAQIPKSLCGVCI